MTDEEIGKRLRLLVKNKGRCPLFHNAAVRELRKMWPLLYALVKDIEATK